MREVVIVLGIAALLGSGMVVLWSSFELRSLERAYELNEFLDEWDQWYPFGEIVEDQYEKQHDYYTNVRIVGVIGLIAGAIITLYGFLFVKEAPRPPTTSPSTAYAATGATNFCQYCGRQVAPGAVWCPGCGRKSKPQGHEGDREQEVR